MEGKAIKYIVGILKMAIMLCAISFASCTHKDLCIHHPHSVTLKVEFNWQNAPEANPKGMCVFFYPVEGGDPRRVDFKGLAGGTVELNVGEYNVITYNNDTEGTLFAGQNSFEKHAAYTREGNILEPVLGNSAGGPRSSGTEDERVVITPDMLWGGISLNVQITETGIKYKCFPYTEEETYVQMENEEHIITLYPSQMLCHYSYEIINVENLEAATQMCASLSGMSGGMTIASAQLYEKSVTLPLEARMNFEDSKITGEFFTFGHHEQNTDPHKMLLYVWMSNGDKFYFGEGDPDFDVTEQIHTAPNPRRVHLIIDGLELPKEMGGDDSNWGVSVDDWEEVHNDVTM